MFHQTDNLLTVLYLRLSREDENEGDSNSIVNQKELLLRYAQEHGFTNIKIISDDGYSGVTFNRPGFQELLSLANAGKVGVIITKDLSRLGRNYIEVGKYSEVIFPGLGIRYIAINDGFDSDDLDGNELAPFKNLFNEWFARDTSKKIRAVFKSKAASGKSLTNNAPYGYKRGKEGEPHLVIDEETAPVVKRIFQMCAQGLGPTVISTVLKNEKVLKPTIYRYQKLGNYATNTDINEPYGWTALTVSYILENEAYLGHTVNCRTSVISYKDKRKKKTTKEQQIRIENTHEAIIDQATWDIVQSIRANKRRRNRLGEVNKYSGLLYCYDCGSPLTFLCSRRQGGRVGFMCSNYRKHADLEPCTTHYIKETQLDQIVLEEINKALYFARTKTDEFAEYISKKTSAQSRKELNAKMKELAKVKQRSSELITLFTRLYEDNVLGRISDDQYRMLAEAYTTEKREVDAKIPDLEHEVEQLKESTSNVQRFTDLAKKYVVIEELTTEILQTFISKIVIHEREERRSRSSPQQIDIYFRYIDFPTCLDRLEKLDEITTENAE